MHASLLSTTLQSSTTKVTTSSYPLLSKVRQSHDSYLLRFGLPSSQQQQYLGNDPTLPTCIAVHHNSTLLVKDEDGNNKDGMEKKMVGLLKKSYSPVSHPGQIGTFDLLV